MARTTRARVWTLIGGVVAGMGIAACIVAPPPDLPQPSPQPPVILPSVSPPTDQALYTWPDGPPNDLLVPVVVNDPSVTYQYIVRVDGAFRTPESFDIALDGGATTLDIAIPLDQFQPPIDPNTCHQITVVVAQGFTADTPNPPGGAPVTWNYMPSVVPDSCSGFDGAPPPDAAPDALSIGPQADSGVP